jgi:chitinase
MIAQLRFRFALLMFLLLSVLVGAPLSAQDSAPEYRIVGYYSSWSIYARQYFVPDIPADKLTHINYAFANISDAGECILGDSWADTEYSYPGDTDTQPLRGNFHQLNLLKQAHPHLRTFISVGGWSWSGKFSDVALTAESREIFARSCVDFMLEYGFDGIDLDWEYPAGGGDIANVERPEDEENFILLLDAVRTELDARGDGYLLTIAAGAGRAKYATLDWVRIHALLDWINVMAYDLSGGWSAVTGFNAPLYNSTARPPEGTSVDTAMQDYVALGVPAEKLILGVPFYGYGWAAVSATNNGLHQPWRGRPPGTWEAGAFDYSDLLENYIDGAYTRYWDEAAQVPYLYNADEGVMITYDDPESLAIKAQYVRDQGFGGVMFWELSPDDDAATLLTTLYETLNTP